MKFAVNSTELQRILSKLGGVIPSKSTMPILENILFELSGGLLTLTATDIAISLTLTMKVDGKEDGKIAVPAKRLMDTMRSLPDTNASFTIDTGTNKVRIHTDTGQYQLTGEPAKEYPQIITFKGEEQFTLDTTHLRRIIHRTVFAVSTDELRPAMMGVLFQAKGNDLRTVSTDGHRLVRIIHKMQNPPGLKRDIIVPAKALHVVMKSVEEGETTIGVTDTHVKFSFNDSLLVSRLIDETYPNYESVIPADNTKQMKVNREAMIGSIRRVALYASQTTHQVRFQIEKDNLQITAQDIDFGGEARETIACSYDSEPLEIGFNSQYLVDILTHLENQDVVMKFSTPTRAGIISPHDDAGHDDVVMLVMPVRLTT
jgi:DNA polymerase III subunit beta